MELIYISPLFHGGKEMFKKVLGSLSIVIILALVFQVTEVLSKNSKNFKFKILSIEKISRFNEDRIAFQHIEKTYNEDLLFDKVDNSIASLLIVRDRKIYLFKDGFDNLNDVITQKKIMDMENRLIPDLWINKIDNKPDYVIVTDRRMKILEKVSVQEKNASGKITTNKNLPDDYSNIYKEVRDKFLKNHVKIFKTLMVSYKENVFVNRKPLPKRLYDQGETKYFTSVSAKTLDETLYYAEDEDGDNITETFTVTLPDGFNWGGQSGPNIIFIYKCKYLDKNNKEMNTEIKNSIGTLAKEAYFGTEKEDKLMTKTLQKEKDEIKFMIDDIYRIIENK